MLSEMGDCAYRLGVAFAAEAEAADDWTRKTELFQLFDRCFFSVRVAIALELRLEREPGRRTTALVSHGAGRDEHEQERLERERVEALERDDRSNDGPGAYTERDRDREDDRERASLPLLLSTLSGVAHDAAALPGPAPAALPALKDLLSRVGVQATPPRRPTPRPSPSTGPVPLRARLSAGVALAIPLPPASGAASPLCRATGPPRRR
ncbi:hypothetical protein [Phenylobacterium sp.]|uniref:hypothetical protein n=1 Tax=Phenylobacterium sp. TaxID=1871053 RepID=UPI0025CDDE8D|nr:hypothetical protein [Phenylobacterium sp.]